MTHWFGENQKKPSGNQKKPFGYENPEIRNEVPSSGNPQKLLYGYNGIVEVYANRAYKRSRIAGLAVLFIWIVWIVEWVFWTAKPLSVYTDNDNNLKIFPPVTEVTEVTAGNSEIGGCTVTLSTLCSPHRR